MRCNVQGLVGPALGGPIPPLPLLDAHGAVMMESIIHALCDRWRYRRFQQQVDPMVQELRDISHQFSRKVISEGLSEWLREQGQ